jgi:hypothetical protein
MSVPAEPASSAPPEERIAWLVSLTPEQWTVCHVPQGYKFSLLAIACIKRAVAQPGMKAGERLHWLEKLNGMTDNYISEEMLAVIERMGDTEMAIVREAMSLNRADDHGMPSFRVLTSWKVFNDLLSLNPSLLAAIKFSKKQFAVATTLPPQE